MHRDCISWPERSQQNESAIVSLWVSWEKRFQTFANCRIASSSFNIGRLWERPRLAKRSAGTQRAHENAFRSRLLNGAPKGDYYRLHFGLFWSTKASLPRPKSGSVSVIYQVNTTFGTYLAVRYVLFTGGRYLEGILCWKSIGAARKCPISAGMRYIKGPVSAGFTVHSFTLWKIENVNWC